MAIASAASGSATRKLALPSSGARRTRTRGPPLLCALALTAESCDIWPAVKLAHYGWVRDIPDQRDLLYAPPPAISPALPPKVDLRPQCPPPHDQGQLGSCTANAIAGALQFLEGKEGSPSPVMPSRLFIYYNERALEGP